MAIQLETTTITAYISTLNRPYSFGRCLVHGLCLGCNLGFNLGCSLGHSLVHSLGLGIGRGLGHRPGCSLGRSLGHGLWCRIPYGQSVGRSLYGRGLGRNHSFHTNSVNFIT
ncbi:hypothetical protein ACTA71_010141 [Dictyostelium dimigraforme]